MMPKIKTHSGAKKRFKKTASGKIKRRKVGARHLMSSKDNGRLRRMGEAAYVDDGNYKRISRLIPHM
jgi:large subunit ribosomal protein L35